MIVYSGRSTGKEISAYITFTRAGCYAQHECESNAKYASKITIIMIIITEIIRMIAIVRRRIEIVITTVATMEIAE